MVVITSPGCLSLTVNLRPTEYKSRLSRAELLVTVSGCPLMMSYFKGVLSSITISSLVLSLGGLLGEGRVLVWLETNLLSAAWWLMYQRRSEGGLETGETH